MKEKSKIHINQEEIAEYLKDIRKLPVMTPDREKELSERMLSQDITEQEKKQIQQELLEGNLNDPEDFHHIGYAQARMHDCDAIAAHLKSQGKDTSFWENVKKGKQDPWEKLKKNDINKQMVQYERPANSKIKV